MMHVTFDTMLGTVRATFARGAALRRLRFADEVPTQQKEHDARAESPARTLATQLRAYFRGERRAFDVPLALEGSAFEKRVWTVLRAIPFGATITYGALAAQLGRPEAPQAVGRACGANPTLVVVPCHRVVDAGGGLAGYAGGSERKAALLRHEGALLI